MPYSSSISPTDVLFGRVPAKILLSSTLLKYGFVNSQPGRTSVGEMEDEYVNVYAVIQNRDFYKTAEIKLSLKDNFRVFEVSKEDGKQRVIFDSVNELPLTLEPGDAVLYRFQKASEEAFTVEYELA